MLGWARGHELGAPGPGMGLGAGAPEMSAGAVSPMCRLVPRAASPHVATPAHSPSLAPGKRGSRAACLVSSQAFVVSCVWSL